MMDTASRGRHRTRARRGPNPQGPHAGRSACCRGRKVPARSETTGPGHPSRTTASRPPAFDAGPGQLGHGSQTFPTFIKRSLRSPRARLGDGRRSCLRPAPPGRRARAAAGQAQRKRLTRGWGGRLHGFLAVFADVVAAFGGTRSVATPGPLKLRVCMGRSPVTRAPSPCQSCANVLLRDDERRLSLAVTTEF